MNKTLLHKLLLATATGVVVFMPMFAGAQIFPGTGNGGGVGGGLDNLRNQSDVEDLNLPDTKEAVIIFIGRLINWALYLSGAIAVLFVIIGGYRYITSAGNEEGAKKGRATLIDAVIGLVIVILAYVIVNVLVNFITS